jgi:hypothetical protein
MWKSLRFICVTIIAAALIGVCVRFFVPAIEELTETASLLFGSGIWVLAVTIAFFNELHCHADKSKSKKNVDKNEDIRRDGV